MGLTFSIGLRTIRRTPDYCHQTTQRLLESETLTSPALLGFHISHGEGLSPNANAVQALRRAAQDHADWVLFLEDDVDLIDDLLPSTTRWLWQFATPEVRFYPLGCAYPSLVLAQRKTGAWKYPLVDTFYGSQAVLFRTDDAQAYADWLATREDTGPPVYLRKEICFDLWLTRWHREVEPAQEWVLTPSPCFVDHVGEQSTMAMKPASHRCPRFEAFGGRAFRWGV